MILTGLVNDGECQRLTVDCDARSAALPIIGAPRAFSVLVLGVEHNGNDGQDWLEEDELEGTPLAHAHKRPIDRKGRHAACAVEEGGIHDISVHLHLCRAQHAVNERPPRLTEHAHLGHQNSPASRVYKHGLSRLHSSTIEASVIDGGARASPQQIQVPPHTPGTATRNCRSPMPHSCMPDTRSESADVSSCLHHNLAGQRGSSVQIEDVSAHQSRMELK